MARSPAQRLPPLDFTKPAPGDRIEAAPAPGAGPWQWGVALVWFMRLVAVLWLAKGLGAWAVILGIWAPAGLFEARDLSYQVTTVYFAAVDLIAAVGLWLAGTWGGVLWLLAAMSHLILAAFFPSFVPGSLVISIVFLVLIGAYLGLSWMISRGE